MRSSTPGNDTSATEITHISSYGIWLLADNEEFFMSYDDFPWFKDQPVRAILNVEQPSQGHFYWPEIDVDLSREIINNPDRFPLKAKTTS
ncbi:MAG: DUF2442 domain-containing protein [Nitrospira sp.]|nr:DUF2442 domain-containing protein [Nitrospira sp.]